MPRHDFNEHDEAIADICDYEEANPWHCDVGSSNLDYEYMANGWVHVPDDPDVQNGPDCPIDVLDALEFCGRLAYEIAIGEPVSTEQAAKAAGRAVKCFACYEYEQQPWFTEAWPFVKEPEPNDTRADDDEVDELRGDAVPGGEGERETTA